MAAPQEPHGIFESGGGPRHTDVGYVPPVSQRAVVRLSGDSSSVAQTAVAEEVPVAFVYNRRPHVVMMATPTDLEDLAVGFTVTEEIAAAHDITRIEVARYSRGIELSIEIPREAGERLEQRARAISGRTGCGLCGVEAIEDAVRPPRLVTATFTVTPDALWRAGRALDAFQLLNRQTHAIHAAAWSTPDGVLHIVREDVGRHNALDKTLGALAKAALDPTTGFLLLTSRASFELVQKAAVCGVSLVAAVSRPTGLAVTMADTAGMTLVGLLRGESANVYTHAHRIADTA